MAQLVERHQAGIAQLVERQLPKLNVAGSNPVARSIAAGARPARTRGRMGWFEKKGNEGEAPEASADRASLANLAIPATGTAPQPAVAQAPAPQQQAALQASVFGKTADIEGSVEGHGDLVLRGTVRGSIHVTGSLLIEPSGCVQADVAAREVINAGTVEGNIIASERVRVADGGRVDGDIDAPSIIIDDGGGVEGFIQMEPPGGEDFDDEDDAFVPPPPIKNLRSSIPAKPDKAERVRPMTPAPAAAAPLASAPAGPPSVAAEPEAPESGGNGQGSGAPDADAPFGLGDDTRPPMPPSV